MTKTRPQLSSQIDRLDGILDTFEDAIPETVRDAVKEAVKEVMAAAIKAAVVEVLRNPTIREATAPISAPVAPPAPKPTLLWKVFGYPFFSPVFMSESIMVEKPAEMSRAIASRHTLPCGRYAVFAPRAHRISQ
jgi:hypothetical protein